MSYIYDPFYIYELLSAPVDPTIHPSTPRMVQINGLTYILVPDMSPSSSMPTAVVLDQPRGGARLTDLCTVGNMGSDGYTARFGGDDWPRMGGMTRTGLVPGGGLPALPREYTEQEAYEAGGWAGSAARNARQDIADAEAHVEHAHAAEDRARRDEDEARSNKRDLEILELASAIGRSRDMEYRFNPLTNLDAGPRRDSPAVEDETRFACEVRRKGR